jgi:hypothetical protein
MTPKKVATLERSAKATVVLESAASVAGASATAKTAAGCWTTCDVGCAPTDALAVVDAVRVPEGVRELLGVMEGVRELLPVTVLVGDVDSEAEGERESESDADAVGVAPADAVALLDALADAVEEDDRVELRDADVLALRVLAADCAADREAVCEARASADAAAVDVPLALALETPLRPPFADVVADMAPEPDRAGAREIDEELVELRERAADPDTDDVALERIDADDEADADAQREADAAAEDDAEPDTEVVCRALVVDGCEVGVAAALPRDVGENEIVETEEGEADSAPDSVSAADAVVHAVGSTVVDGDAETMGEPLDEREAPALAVPDALPVAPPVLEGDPLAVRTALVVDVELSVAPALGVRGALALKAAESVAAELALDLALAVGAASVAEPAALAVEKTVAADVIDDDTVAEALPSH